MQDLERLEEFKVFLTLTDVDLKLVKSFFDREDSPGYTILSEKKMDNGFIKTEMFFDTPVRMWYLAKQVQLFADSDERLEKARQEIVNKLKK
jgi:hypothetical protein